MRVDEPQIGWHPAAELFPMLTNGEYRRLKDDIAQHGQIHPIVLCEGKILDGRNRYRACFELGIDPRFEEYAGDSPVSFAWSMNGARRHLTASQLAAAGARMRPMLSVEAKERQRATQFAGGKPPDSRLASKDADRAEHTKSSHQAAAIVGSSSASVERASFVLEHDPELFARIEAGEITVTTAHKQAKEARGDKSRRKAADEKAAEDLLDENHRRAVSRETRAEQIQALAETGHAARQIAGELGISLSSVRAVAKDFGITLPDAHIGKTRHHDSRRIIETTVHTLEGLALGLSVISDYTDATQDECRAWVKSLDASIATIRKLRKQLAEISNGNE